MLIKDDTAILWMVIRSDDNGPAYIMQENMTETDAIDLVLEYTAKKHKQLYQALSYTTATRETLIEKERILI